MVERDTRAFLAWAACLAYSISRIPHGGTELIALFVRQGRGWRSVVGVFLGLSWDFRRGCVRDWKGMAGHSAIGDNIPPQASVRAPSLRC